MTEQALRKKRPAVAKPGKPWKPKAERATPPRMLAFAIEYAKTGNGAASARAAGYTAAYAEARAHDLLRDPRVQAELASLRDVATQSAEVDLAQVIRDLKAIAHGDLARFRAGGVGVKLADKIRALELLGKSKALFVEKVEHSGEVKTQAPVINLTLTAPAAKADGSG